MFSVTKRIAYVRQPEKGYIPLKTLNVKEYFDDLKINKIDSAFKSIQGMAVDYLTRYMSGTPKNIAFQISLKGAENVDELDKANMLLSKITGLDADSICAACQLVGYDVAYRYNPKYFNPKKIIIPNKKTIQNIVVLVNRSVKFLKNNGPIIMDGFTFEGGYNEVISSGDGDYLTTDTLWDFKVSKYNPDTSHTLQILIYYILGVHSIHPEFQSIKKLGIFNPELNKSYSICLSDIPDEVFQSVSRDVIGYCTPKEAEQWRTATGTSEKAINEVKSYFSYLFKDTGFSPDNYDDGIHDISVDDYWSYYKELSDNLRPKFSRTHSVKFIKNSGYYMFVSLSEKGATSILKGGSLRKLKKPLQYYYERLPEYATTVLNKFSKYWEALYCISNQIQSISINDEELRQEYERFLNDLEPLEPEEEADYEPWDYESWLEYYKNMYRFSGKVHGCIVDIDYYNHIYLNPYDGTIAPYSAPSMYMKYVYNNVPSLIAKHRPEMLPAFNRAIEESTDKEATSLVLADSKEKRALSILEKHEIDEYNVPVTDISMYTISNRMKELQAVYDHNLVVVWYDDFLPHYELESKKVSSKSLKVGETKTMNCGMAATVLSDNGYKSITIQFEDGTIVENCCRNKFREGKIRNPSLKKERPAPRKKESYVGKTAVMKCGLKATVIEDFGCNNLTVQFEDGLIKKNCRRDKFREGKIGHRV